MVAMDEGQNSWQSQGLDHVQALMKLYQVLNGVVHVLLSTPRLHVHHISLVIRTRTCPWRPVCGSTDITIMSLLLPNPIIFSLKMLDSNGKVMLSD